MSGYRPDGYRRQILRGRVSRRRVLAFAGDEPAGWCAVAPREDYPGLGRSRILKAVDDTPVWSVSCLFVAKEFRNRGVSVALLKAAVGRRRPHLAGLPLDFLGRSQLRWVLCRLHERSGNQALALHRVHEIGRPCASQGRQRFGEPSRHPCWGVEVRRIAGVLDHRLQLPHEFRKADDSLALFG